MVSSSLEFIRSQPDTPGLRIEVTRDPQVTTLKVEGDVDLATAGLLKAAAELALAEPPLRVVVDLSQVNFFSAAGLRVLLHLREDAYHAAVDVVLCAPSPAVRTVLNVADAAQHFRIDPAGFRRADRGQSLASDAAH